MNLKIIHSDFEIDLVDTSFTMIEENNWFNDRVYSKYTYPISITLSDELIAKLKFLTENSASGYKTLFNVYFYAMEKEHEAVFEIEGAIGREIDAQIRYGFEEFPNFSKKLAQLPLWKFDLIAETMYQHAKDRVAMSYPTTDYVFTQVITNEFDTSTDQWQYFEGIINNYKNSAFLINEYNGGTDEQVNRNVIQPLPCILYLLKTGFLDAGFTLEGDILTDPEFSKASLYSLSSFYSSITQNGKQELLVASDEFSTTTSYGYKAYHANLTIAEPGRYKISGNLFLKWILTGIQVVRAATAKFTFNGEEIANWEVYQNEFKLVDLIVEVFPGQSNLVLEFQSVQFNLEQVGGLWLDDSTILDISVVQLSAYDANGDLTPTLISPNEIDLTKCVPDKTFGDLYNMVNGWKNYDIDITGTVVTMNLVSNQIGLGPKKDLQEFEVKKPERRFNQGKTFELKFQDVQSDVYTFPSIYVDANGVHQSPYIKKEETQEILIDAIALPLKQSGAVLTADGFIDDNTKFQIVLYNGLINSLNLAANPSALTLVNIYPVYYKDWMNFLLNTVSFKWKFNSYYEKIKDLTIKSSVFAYGQYHVVKKISRKNVSNEIIQTEIETESID